MTLVYRIGILHQYLVIVFNLKIDVFNILQPSQFVIFSFFFLISYYICNGQKYGLACLNDRITCNYRISTRLLEFSYLNKWCYPYVYTCLLVSFWMKG